MHFLGDRANHDIEESEKDKQFSSNTRLTRIIDSQVIQIFLPSGDSLIADPSHEDNRALRCESRSRPRIEPSKLGPPRLVDIRMTCCVNTVPLYRWLMKMNQILGS